MLGAKIERAVENWHGDAGRYWAILGDVETITRRSLEEFILREKQKKFFPIYRHRNVEKKWTVEWKTLDNVTSSTVPGNATFDLIPNIPNGSSALTALESASIDPSVCEFYVFQWQKKEENCLEMKRNKQMLHRQLQQR